jgi:hypothetical protein
MAGNRRSFEVSDNDQSSTLQEKERDIKKIRKENMRFTTRAIEGKESPPSRIQGVGGERYAARWHENLSQSQKDQVNDYWDAQLHHSSTAERDHPEGATLALEYERRKDPNYEEEAAPSHQHEGALSHQQSQDYLMMASSSKEKRKERHHDASPSETDSEDA